MAALAAICIATAPAAAWNLPLKLSDDGGRLVDQDNTPFLINGDAPWSLIVELTLEEAETYLEDRRQRGFTLVMVNLIEHQFSSDPPNNRNGDAPFLTPGDYSTPNAAYFSHADAVLDIAEAKGLVVLLTPSYLGYGGGNEGWYQEMLANDLTTLRNYGRWLGTRYRDYDNIVWLNGGDYSPPNQDVVEAIAEGIRETDDRHLHSVHTGPDDSASAVYPDAAWLDINNTYSYADNLYVHTLGDYNRTPFKPFFMIESHYEANWIDPPPARIRRQAWWPMFTGAQGHIMGNFPVWYFGDGWEDALDSDGAADMTHWRAFFDAIPWPGLVPDQNHSLVTDGYGVFYDTDYVTAAWNSSAGIGAAYIPPTGTGSRTVTLDLTRFAADVTARWYNPADGTWQTDEDSPLPPDAGVEIDTPGANGDGANDWALVLEPDTGTLLVVEKIKLGARFDESGRDKAKLKARIPALAAAFDPDGATVTVGIGGASEDVTLDARGRGASGDAKLKMKYSASKGWQLAASWKNGSYASDWIAAGLVDAAVSDLVVPIDVETTADGITYAAVQSIRWSAKAGAKGTGR